LSRGRHFTGDSFEKYPLLLISYYSDFSEYCNKIASWNDNEQFSKKSLNPTLPGVPCKQSRLGKNSILTLFGSSVYFSS
jgi:hypothetical protein